MRRRKVSREFKLEAVGLIMERGVAWSSANRQEGTGEAPTRKHVMQESPIGSERRRR